MKLIVSVLSSAHPRYQFEVHYPDGNKRKVKYFGFNREEKNQALTQSKRAVSKVKKRAQAWAKDKDEKLKLHGVKIEEISDAEKRAIEDFRERLNKHSEQFRHHTLQDAVNMFLDSLKVEDNPMTCQEVADSLIDYLRAENKSERHISTTESRLKRFNAEYGDWLVSDISTVVINDFIKHLKTTKTKNVKAKTASIVTKKNYRLSLSGMFSHALEVLKATQMTPVSNAINPKVNECEIGILDPVSVEKLMNVADERCRAGLAISFFAGLRRSEIEQLDWKEVKLKQGKITVLGRVSKSGKKRHVEISENLKLWLEPLHQNTGKVTGTTAQWRRGTEKARKDAGITDWPNNAGRHSFATYHVAMHENAGKTALQLGHKGDPTLLHEHYDAVLDDDEEAVAFWSIKPAQEENITNIKSA